MRKKKTDTFDFLLNLSILVLVGFLIDQYWFSPTRNEELLFDEDHSGLVISEDGIQGGSPTLVSQTPQILTSNPDPSSSESSFTKPFYGNLDLEKIEKERIPFLANRKNKILISKLDHQLFLIDESGFPIGPFTIAIGKNPDRKPKEQEGDKRTPEGEYKVKAVMRDDHHILKKWNALHLKAASGHHKFGKPFEDLGKNSYGPRFLLLDYPNEEDRQLGRTGSGIGIHGTNDPDSLGYEATSGCVRMANEQIVWLSKWIGAGTPVKIVPKFD